MNGKMSEWKDGWMDGWMNEWMMYGISDLSHISDMFR